MRRAEFVRCAASVWPASACRANVATAAPFPETLIWYARSLHRGGDVLCHDANRILPAASIIKLLIARTIVDVVAGGELALDTGIPLQALDRVGGSDRYGNARVGRYPLRALLAAMLSLSDNTAANALLRAAGMQRCNDSAVALGLAATRIRRTFYDWEAQRRGRENTTTPAESAKLLVDLARRAGGAGRGGDAARAVMQALLAQTDRETIPAAVPAHTAVANKTGELPGIRHDVAIVDYGRSSAYVVAIMSRYRAGVSRAAAIRDIRAVAADIDRRLRPPTAIPSARPGGRPGREESSGFSIG